MTDPDEPVTYSQKFAAKRLIELAELRGDTVPQHLRDKADAPLKNFQRNVRER